MEHIPFDIICKIADEYAKEKEVDSYIAHLELCKSCRKEVELQRSILKASRNVQLISPSKTFTDDVLEVILPAGKKKWYEWILQNMGNVLAMAAVVVFLVYVLSITETTSVSQESSNKNTQITEIIKTVQDVSLKFYQYLIPNINLPNIAVSGMETITLALIALVLLVFVDQIMSYFLKHLKILS